MLMLMLMLMLTNEKLSKLYGCPADKADPEVNNIMMLMLLLSLTEYMFNINII